MHCYLLTPGIALQLKKEAERAWDSDKDKDGAPYSKPKPVNGSTKRVEQFRKNMRRWMIGEPLLPGHSILQSHTSRTPEL